MDKNFQCKSCGLAFMADDSQEVKCPSCESDNVDYYKAKKSLNKTYLWAGIAFIAAVGLGVGLKFIFYGKADMEDIPELEAEESVLKQEVVNEESPVQIVGEPIREITLIYNDDFKADPKTKTYSFSFKGNNLPENADNKYELYDFATGKLVMSSSDGAFTKVPPAEDSMGSYRIKLTVNKGEQNWEAYNVVTGCVKFPEATLPKLSVAQVQGLINQMLNTGNSAVLSANPHFAQKINFRYNGLQSDDVAPTSFSKLLQQVNMGLWSNMKVLNVRYDDNTNQIVEMTIQPVYAD